MKLSIPLPWRVTYYDILRDEIKCGWQRLFIGFVRVPAGFRMWVGIRQRMKQ